MNGSPASTGGIQGTSSHASALKKVEWNKYLQRKTDKRGRLEGKLEKREEKGKNTDRINKRIDKNQDKINKEYYKLNPKKSNKKTDPFGKSTLKMYDSPAQTHEEGHGDKNPKALQGMMDKVFKKEGKQTDRKLLPEKKEDKRNKLINKRTKLKEKGKEKETSGKLRRTQNKINKIDGSKVRHKKGFLGLGKYKKVRKD